MVEGATTNAARRWAAAYAPRSKAIVEAQYLHELEDLTLIRVWLAAPTPESLATAQALLADSLPGEEAAGRTLGLLA